MLELAELGRRSVLDVDQGDGVAGIGEPGSEAPAHPACPETGNCDPGDAHWANPSRNSRCNWLRSSSPKPNALRLRSGAPTSSPQITPPIARKALANGVATPARSATETRNDKPRRRSSIM